MLSRHRLLAAAAAVVAMAACADTAGAASRSTLSGSVPGWAKSSNAKGAPKSGDAVGFRVYLGLRNASQAESLAAAVSNPKSSSYGDYLTPAQFRQRFAPAEADVNAVKSWLRDQGMDVEYTPTNNRYVAAEGTVAQVESAFATTLKDYTVRGKTLRAPATALSVPASLDGTVQGVLGIDQSDALVHTDHADAPPSVGFRNAPPCSAYWAEKRDTAQPGNYPYAPCGYTPPQLEGAYGLTGAINGGNDGSGQTVAIIDAYASPTIESDANTYFSRHGLSPFRANQFTQQVAPGTYKRPENNRQDPQGWYGEETLDVEAVHTTAPGANILFVGAPNNYQDLDAALNHVVDRHLASIVTNSYGWSTELLPKGYITPVENTLVQAAAEGIGVYFSSGDDGDEVANDGYRTVDWPASSPWVTAVGGTSLGVGRANDYVGETGWSTAKSTLNADNTWSAPSYLYGAGGGTSRVFAEPDYQKGVVPGGIANYFGSPGRAVPDVGMLADPQTGMLVGQTQTFSDGTYYDEYRIGGTSLASPLFAGTMALADQKAGRAHGFANPALYRAAGTGAYHDVSGNPLAAGVVRVDYANSENASDGLLTSLRWLNYPTTIKVRPGYDDVTGVGTPDGPSFLSALGH
jgi:subtilase family serine protease